MFTFLIFLSSTAHANSVSPNTQISEELKYGNLVSAQEELLAENITLKEDLITLSNELITIKNQINESKENEGIEFEVWVGLLLACVTLIVTGLGVVIALSAFFGYSNIKHTATDAAVKKSESLVEQAIQTGHFNKLIYSAVERAVYRDILSENDFPEDEEVSA